MEKHSSTDERWHTQGDQVYCSHGLIATCKDAGIAEQISEAHNREITFREASRSIDGT